LERRIVCAAIAYPRIGIMLVGPRHFDKIMQDQYDRFFSVTPPDGEENVQGFLDQYGEFLTRKEAHEVAKNANQIIRRCGGDEGKLFSENLY